MFIFTVHRYASAVLAVVMCLCLSVCLSIHLSDAGIVAQRPNIGSRKQLHMVARESSFLLPKILVKIEQGHEMQVE